MNRWSKNGVLTRALSGLAEEGIINLEVETYSLDSTIVKVHPDAAGAQKNGPQAIGKSRTGLTTKIHLLAADDRTAVTFTLSPGQDHDAADGRALVAGVGPQPEGRIPVADRAYEGDETRQLAFDLDYTPVIPPKSNRKQPWAYDREAYKRRNEVERLFRRLIAYRRIFSRSDTLDIIYTGFLTFFITFVLIIEALRNVNTP